MLQRPKRPLPRKFSRRATRATRTFVERKHQRHAQHRRERLKRWLRRTQTTLRSLGRALRRWLLAIIAVVFCFIVGLFAFSPIIQVREIHIQRTQGRVDVRAVQEALAPFFGRHLFFLTPREVAAAVTQTVPDLDRVSVHKDYPSRLTVSITVKPVIARLQIQGPPQSSSGSAATASGGHLPPPQPSDLHDYLTENGIYITARSVESSGNLPLISIVDWAARPVPGTLLLKPDFLSQMQKAEQVLTDQFGQHIRARTVYLRAQEFHLQTGTIALWFDTQSPLEEQLARYRTFLQTVGPKAARQYVDLRVAGRVMYR